VPANTTYWDFTELDPLMEDFLAATVGRNRTVFINFSTPPQWLYAGEGGGWGEEVDRALGHAYARVCTRSWSLLLPPTPLPHGAGGRVSYPDDPHTVSTSGRVQPAPPRT